MEIEVQANRAKILIANFSPFLLATSFFLLYNFVTHSLKVARVGVYLTLSTSTWTKLIRGCFNFFSFSQVEEDDDSELWQVICTKNYVEHDLIALEIDRYVRSLLSSVISSSSVEWRSIEKRNGHTTMLNKFKIWIKFSNENRLIFYRISEINFRHLLSVSSTASTKLLAKIHYQRHAIHPSSTKEYFIMKLQNSIRIIRTPFLRDPLNFVAEFGKILSSRNPFPRKSF